MIRRIIAPSPARITPAIAGIAPAIAGIAPSPARITPGVTGIAPSIIGIAPSPTVVGVAPTVIASEAHIEVYGHLGVRILPGRISSVIFLLYINSVLVVISFVSVNVREDLFTQLAFTFKILFVIVCSGIPHHHYFLTSIRSIDAIITYIPLFRRAAGSQREQNRKKQDA